INRLGRSEEKSTKDRGFSVVASHTLPSPKGYSASNLAHKTWSWWELIVPSEYALHSSRLKTERRQILKVRRSFFIGRRVVEIGNHRADPCGIQRKGQCQKLEPIQCFETRGIESLRPGEENDADGLNRIQNGPGDLLRCHQCGLRVAAAIFEYKMPPLDFARK